MFRLLPWKNPYSRLGFFISTIPTVLVPGGGQTFIRFVVLHPWRRLYPEAVVPHARA
jgi:hypothetical protein